MGQGSSTADRSTGPPLLPLSTPPSAAGPPLGSGLGTTPPTLLSDLGTAPPTLLSDLGTAPPPMISPPTPLIMPKFAGPYGMVHTPDLSTFPWRTSPPLPEIMGTSWTCCRISHDVYRQSFADIPHVRCSVCRSLNLTSYSWSLSKWTINGVQLDPEVLSQKGKHCAIFAFFSACQFIRVTRGATHGWFEPANLCIDRMLLVVEQVTGIKVDDWASEYLVGVSIFETILISAFRGGIPFMRSEYDTHRAVLDPTSQIRFTQLKLKCWFRVDMKDVEKITRLLAEGYPLLAVVPIGRLFQFVSGKQIYFAPRKGTPSGKHAVCLHGSGSAHPKGTYYHARNTHGNLAHPDYEKEGKGGDFYVWADDVMDYVYGFELAV